MFTGIIELTGKVISNTSLQNSKKLSVDIGVLAEGTKIGDSIAVNGLCLTVTALSGSVADFDVSSQSLAVSNIGMLGSAMKVNLERAMSADGRFGGHIVQGHVDGLGTVKRVERREKFCEIAIAVPKDILDLLIVKGSVAINGVSLTIAEIQNDSFTVWLIPATLEATTFGSMRVSEKVNIEADMIVKTVKNSLSNMLGTPGGLTINKLRELGF